MTFSKTLTWLTAAAALVAFGACGDDARRFFGDDDDDQVPGDDDDDASSVGGGSPYAYPNQDEFCAGLASALCTDTLLQACYGSIPATVVTDLASCRAAVTSSAVCNPANLPYHPKSAETCVASWSVAYLDGAITAVELALIQRSCLEVFYAGFPPGSACFADADCDISSSLRCLKKPGQTLGTCHLPEIKNGGMSCGSDNEACAEGFFCSIQHDLMCVEQLDLGAHCSAYDLCKDYYYCSTATQMCVPKKTHNESCTSAPECEGGLCLKQDDAAVGTCTAIIELSAHSPACEPFTVE